MKVNKSNNFLILLAAFLVVGLAIMSYVISNQDRKIVDVDTFNLTKQSTSDEADSIKKDLDDTELDNLDKELIDIETELNSSSD